MSYNEIDLEDKNWLSKLLLTERYILFSQFVNMINAIYNYTHNHSKQIIEVNHIYLAIGNLGWAKCNDGEIHITYLGKKFIYETEHGLYLKKEGQILLKIYFIEHLSNNEIINDEKVIESKPFNLT